MGTSVRKDVSDIYSGNVPSVQQINKDIVETMTEEQAKTANIYLKALWAQRARWD